MIGATGPSLPTSARAVIVGAGIVGASVAYHLTREGWTDKVVVGLLVENDGIAKAVRAAEAMGRAAAADGGLRAFGGCEATGLRVEGGRVRGVETALGLVETET